MTVWERLERVLETYDSSFEVDIGTASCWAGTLRVTLTNPENEPSRSMTFHRVAGLTPDEIAEAVLTDFYKWLSESDAEPLPPPEWMFED
jgi:hypothetical protein